MRSTPKFCERRRSGGPDVLYLVVLLHMYVFLHKKKVRLPLTNLKRLWSRRDVR